jgi:tetratricopeptide (TPR) repeat protein
MIPHSILQGIFFMRRPALLTMLTFFALLFAAPSAAQDAIDLTLYRDADSLTIFAPSVPYGLALQVTLPDGRTLTQSLVAYPAFRGAQPDAPACFRLERAGSASPAPQDCPRAQIHIQTLTDGDVFWHDSTLNQDFTLLIVRDEQIYGVCAAGISRCSATFIPAPQEVALCDGAADLENREVLVVIATFRQISGNPLEPHYEWEIILDDAIDQLKGQVNARVLVVPQIITSQEEALTISDCFNATLVIWGRVAAARVESNYTTVARWSFIELQPAQTDFQANSTQPQSVLDQLTFFVSLDGGDTEYILNFVLAQLAYFGENREDAMPFLERAIALAPKGREREMGAAAMYFYAGYIQQAIQGNTEAALRAYSNALEIDPGGSYAATIYNNRGVAYADQGDHAHAIADYTQAIALNPDFANAYNNRGLAYHHQGSYIQAIADYTQAVALNPADADAYNNRGVAYADQGDHAHAIADYTQAIALNPDFANAYNNRGIAYADQDDHAHAIADFTQAIALNPAIATAYYNRGLAYADQGDYAHAIADFTQAIALNPDFANAYNNRGLAYADQGDHAHAIADFTQAIALDPAYVTAYYNRGLAYHHQGSYVHAIADYTQAIALNPADADAYYNRGLAYYRQGDHAHAIADFTQAIALDPAYATAYNNRGNVYADQGDHAHAIADYTQAIALEPAYATAYNNRGAAYADQDDYAHAIADFTQAIALDPTYATAYYNRGNAYADQGDHAHAIADFTQAIALNPAFVNAYYSRGRAYYFQDQYDLAIADFTQAIALNPAFVNAYLGLGFTYDSMERYDDALKTFRQYLDIMGDSADPQIVARVAELEEDAD